MNFFIAFELTVAPVVNGIFFLCLLAVLPLWKQPG